MVAHKSNCKRKKGNILNPHMNIYHLMHLTIRTVDKSYYKKDLGNARSWNKLRKLLVVCEASV